MLFDCGGLELVYLLVVWDGGVWDGVVCNLFCVLGVCVMWCYVFLISYWVCLVSGVKCGFCVWLRW